jgi:hypothetical protein
MQTICWQEFQACRNTRNIVGDSAEITINKTWKQTVIILFFGEEGIKPKISRVIIGKMLIEIFLGTTRRSESER